MIIARFGDTWAGAYEFSQVRAEDDWGAERPAVTQRVGGAGGEFDFFGDEGFPVSPLVVTKKFDLESTYAGIETALNTLRTATIAAGRTKLWGEWRDGSTHLWAWGKCVRLKAPEKAGGEYVNKRVTLTFRCSEGVWYSEAEEDVGGISYSPSFSVPAENEGNYPALVRASLWSPGVDMNPCAVQTRVGGVAVCQWQFNDTVFAMGSPVVVNARTFEAILNANDVYDDLVVGSSALIGGADTPQVAWLWLPAGIHAFYVASVPGSGVQYSFRYHHTYVM